MDKVSLPLLFYYGPDNIDYTKNTDVTSIVIDRPFFTTENMNDLFGDNAPGHVKYLSIVSKNTNLLLKQISETDVQIIYPSLLTDGDDNDNDNGDDNGNGDGDGNDNDNGNDNGNDNDNGDNVKTVFEYSVLKTFGFIMSRHVRCATTNEYWIEACRCIREFHPENLIIIIDDNSNQEFVTENNVYNCIVIQSEFHGAGELLPYYYLHKTRLLDKACIINDGTFIKKAIDPENVHDVQFLWNFCSCLNDEEPIVRCIINDILLCDADTRSSLIDRYNNHQFQGCFATMSIISYAFIDHLVKKYGIFYILPHIRGRPWRCSLERLFAVLCFNETSPTTLIGEIFNHPSPFLLNLDGYQSSYKNNYDYPAYKIWTGR